MNSKTKHKHVHYIKNSQICILKKNYKINNFSLAIRVHYYHISIQMYFESKIKVNIFIYLFELGPYNYTFLGRF